MATCKDFNAVALMQKHRSEQIIDAFVTETLVTVVSRTPIDKGVARAGWERTPAGLSDFGTEQVISNDVPYIVRLEFGWSRQAPEGMARLTAAESQERMDAIVQRFQE